MCYKIIHGSKIHTVMKILFMAPIQQLIRSWMEVIPLNLLNMLSYLDREFQLTTLFIVHRKCSEAASACSTVCVILRINHYE